MFKHKDYVDFLFKKVERLFDNNCPDFIYSLKKDAINESNCWKLNLKGFLRELLFSEIISIDQYFEIDKILSSELSIKHL